MQKLIQPIATIMIVLLLLTLIWIFLSYYKGYDRIETLQFVNGDMNVSDSNHSIENEQKSNYENVVSSIIPKFSGDKNEDSENPDQNLVDVSPDGSGNSNANGENTLPNVAIQLPEDKQKPNEIITSSPETSSQEKQEVLTEIDEALKGLLEAVGKVEVVDETRLEAALRQEVETP